MQDTLSTHSKIDTSSVTTFVYTVQAYILTSGCKDTIMLQTSMTMYTNLNHNLPR